MNNAVIYARFSSYGQNEQSIEGQIRVCQELAAGRKLNIVKTYIDKAKTGATDKRNDFQRMIDDAASGAFQYIIVYMFDRFARNRVDSILYKAQLQKQGVKVLSALEPVTDDEGGEFYEMYLEWNAEKYSKRLSKRVRDGLDTSVANGTFCGGFLPFGYKLHKEPIPGKNDKYIKTVVVDEGQAQLVKRIFTEYAKGTEKKDIAAALNSLGHRRDGQPYKGRHFDRILVNNKYTGEFFFGERECKNMFPAIIDKHTFDKVQKRLRQNKYFGGTYTAREPYRLTSKLYCGHCGSPMVADNGTGRLGKTYNYYSCKNMRKGTCDKKREKKAFVEYYIAEQAVFYLNDPKRADYIAGEVVAYFDKKTGNGEIKSIETKIAQTKKQMDDTLEAMIAAASITTKQLLDRKIHDLGIMVEDLETQRALLELERGIRITKKDIISFISEIIRSIDLTDKNDQEKIISNLVNSVYLYDDKVVIYYNIKGGKEISFIGLNETNNAIIELNPTPPMVQGSYAFATGGVGGIRTRASVTRTTSLAGTPLEPDLSTTPYWDLKIGKIYLTIV